MASGITFELTTLPGRIKGEVNWYEKDTGGDYQPIITNPNPAIIHDDQDWSINLEKLTQNGPIWGAWTGNKWHFRVYFERIGSGEGPGRLGISFSVNAGDPFTYPDQVIDISGGDIPVGIYKIYGELELEDKNGKTPVSGLVELGNVKIINA